MGLGPAALGGHVVLGQVVLGGQMVLRSRTTCPKIMCLGEQFGEGGGGGGGGGHPIL